MAGTHDQAGQPAPPARGAHPSPDKTAGTVGSRGPDVIAAAIAATAKAAQVRAASIAAAQKIAADRQKGTAPGGG